MSKKSADTMEPLTDRMTDMGELETPVSRRTGTWATAAAGILAGAAAFAVLRWRKARKAPASRAKRAWRQMKGQVRKTTARMR